MFFSFNLFKTCFISSIAIGSIPAKGSSRSIIFGSAASVLAISTFLLCPPDSCLPLRSIIFDKPNSSMDFSINLYRAEISNIKYLWIEYYFNIEMI